MNVTSQYSTNATNSTARLAVTESTTDKESIASDTTQQISTATESNELYEWSTELLIFEVFNIILLVIVLWLLLNLVAYGIKTGRFQKRAQSSSLNSGIIYTVCVITVFSLLPRLILTAVTHVVARQGKYECEIFGDMATFGYGINLYAIYMFLWLRQRVLYIHPFLKSKVSVAMNWFSRVYVFFLTAVTVVLMCVFQIPKTYFRNERGCYEDRPASTSYILGATFLFTQALMLCLCIYPATRGSIQTAKDEGFSELPTDASRPNRVEIAVSQDQQKSTFGRCCFYLSGVVKSPVEMVIKRTVICSVLVVLTDIVVLLIDAAVFPKDTPPIIRQTTVDISSCIDLFCVVGTFGFAMKVFTLFCPSCSRRSEAKEITHTGSIAESTVDMHV